MKKKFFLMMSFICMLLATATVNAATNDDTNATVTFAEEGKTLTITGTGDLTTNSAAIVSQIAAKVEQTEYSKIVFAGGATVNKEILQAILYPNNKANTSVVNVDLGGVVVDSLSSATFEHSSVQKTALTSLKELTMPLTANTNGEMIVPSNVLTGAIRTYEKLAIATLTIPEGYTKIAEKGFWGCTSLVVVNFPSSLKEIGNMAFSDCTGYESIKLKEGLEIIGNSAFSRTNGVKQEVLEVPSTVKYMGPGSFYFRRYQDVYYYGKTAPLSPLGKVLGVNDAPEAAAFDSQMLFGNNGFSQTREGTTAGNAGEGKANRENYYNGNNYEAVLHFRSDLNNEEAETFTDITRKYLTWTGSEYNNPAFSDGKFYPGSNKEIGQEESQLVFQNQSNYSGKNVTPGFVDTDLGSQVIWPSQSQFMRSYVNSSLGLKFDGVTEYLPELTEEQIALLREQGFTEMGANHTNYNTNTTADGYTVEELKKIAYLGTRQFVLVSRDVKGNPGEVDPGITDGGRWWTLCVPCDVRKSEVDRVFGKDSYLCLFSKVERESTKGGAENVIHLYFQNDTYQRPYTRKDDGTWEQNGTYTEDDPVVLYAHTPYMIYPKNRKDDGHDFILKNYEIKSGDVLRSKVVATDNTEYVYTSTYLDKTAEGSGVTIPQYSYAFGTTKTNKTPQFWFYTGTNGAWKSYKCLVQRYDEDGSEDFASFFKGNVNNARQFSTFGQDSEVTGVDKVIIHIGEGENEAIYSIDGTLVSKSGDTSSLTKGVYIQNGKKFLVK